MVGDQCWTTIENPGTWWFPEWRLSNGLTNCGQPPIPMVTSPKSHWKQWWPTKTLPRFKTSTIAPVYKWSCIMCWWSGEKMTKVLHDGSCGGSAHLKCLGGWTNHQSQEIPWSLSPPKLLRCNCACITILSGCLTVARVLYHCNLPSGSVLQFESTVISH